MRALFFHGFDHSDERVGVSWALKALFPLSVNVGNYFGALLMDMRILFERVWEGFHWIRTGTLKVWRIH